MSDLATTLAQLADRGLLGRVTSLKCGDVELTILPAVARQAESEDRAENARRALEEETLFGSA